MIYWGLHFIDSWIFARYIAIIQSIIINIPIKNVLINVNNHRFVNQYILFKTNLWYKIYKIHIKLNIIIKNPKVHIILSGKMENDVSQVVANFSIFLNV